MRVTKELEALQAIVDACATDSCTWRAEDATVEGYQRLINKIYDIASDASAPTELDIFPCV